MKKNISFFILSLVTLYKVLGCIGGKNEISFFYFFFIFIDNLKQLLFLLFFSFSPSNIGQFFGSIE